jgi:hypothetical protein
LSPFCGDLPATTPQFPGGIASNLTARPADQRSLRPEGKSLIYRHTQRGTLILITCLALGALGLVLSWALRNWQPAVFMFVITIATATLFSSLTVEVADNELRWHFGSGLLNYRLALDEISDVAIVRNQWWNGWGIRMARGFRLYNVSGLDAVELRLHSNGIRRIGTDDPDGLAKVLRARRGLG